MSTNSQILTQDVRKLCKGHTLVDLPADRGGIRIAGHIKANVLSHLPHRVFLRTGKIVVSRAGSGKAGYEMPVKLKWNNQTGIIPVVFQDDSRGIRLHPVLEILGRTGLFHNRLGLRIPDAVP